MLKPTTLFSRFLILGSLAFTACQSDSTLQDSTPVSQSNGGRVASSDLQAYAKLIAESLEDPAIVTEIYDRVLLGYEGVSAIPISLLLGDNLPTTKASKIKAKASAPLISQKLKAKSVGTTLLRSMEEQMVELYWPYWQEWNGRELPTITFTPDKSTTVGVGFKPVLENGKIKLERVTVDDDYAFNHPTWILQKHVPAELTSNVSGRFLPSTIDGPRFKTVDNQISSYAKTSDDDTEDNPGPGDDIDPGDPYPGGGVTPGPEWVPGPTNGTADVNEIYIENVRTDGRNFRDIFGGGDNKILFHIGDKKFVDKNETTKVEVVIDRWAGRKGVWRKRNALWDDNWSALERDQYLMIETLNSGVNKSTTFSGTFKIYIPIIGVPSGTVPGGSTTVDPADPYSIRTDFTLGPFGFSYSRTSTNEVITGSHEMNRRIFFAGNTTNFAQQGMLDGVAIRFGGNTYRSGVYYTLKLVSKNRVN